MSTPKELSAKLKDCTTHEKSEANDEEVDELTALLKTSKTHDSFQAWQDLNDAIEYCEDLLYFGSNEDDSPGGTVSEEELASLRDLAHYYKCAYNGGLLLLLDEEVKMLNEVIASHEPSAFLVKMHAFCEYLRDKKNSEDDENAITSNTSSDEESSEKEEEDSEKEEEDSEEESSDEEEEDREEEEEDSEEESSDEESSDEETSDVDEMEM
jgi:chemotaxis protein histidine kinase CheA